MQPQGCNCIEVSRFPAPFAVKISLILAAIATRGYPQNSLIPLGFSLKPLVLLTFLQTHRYAPPDGTDFYTSKMQIFEPNNLIEMGQWLYSHNQSSTLRQREEGR